MTPTQKAAAFRELAAQLLAVDERAMSLLRTASEDEEEMLERISHQSAAEADVLLSHADMLDPRPFVPTLFQWADGKMRRVAL